jgi:hypothetical protein
VENDSDCFAGTRCGVKDDIQKAIKQLILFFLVFKLRYRDRESYQNVNAL